MTGRPRPSDRSSDRLSDLERALPALHVVTDDDILARADFEDAAAEVLEVGGRAARRPALAFHLRGPATTGARMEYLARALLPRAREAGAHFLINDRVDVAMALEPDGVHLGRRSLPPRLVRDILGPEPLVGLSAHGVDEATPEEREGADYLMVGTLFDSGSHPAREPAGLALLDRIGGVSGGLPLIGIGGITPERVGEVMRSGASGVAVLGAVWRRDDPGGAVEELIGALGEAGMGA